MKKSLLIPAALLMLASCAQENAMEPDPVPQPVGNPYLLPAEDAVAVARQIVANLAQENATRSEMLPYPMNSFGMVYNFVKN